MTSEYYPTDKDFNTEQKHAYCELVKFIDLLLLNIYRESVETLYFLLNGTGGSGKTYLICVLLEYIKKNQLRYKILAPTHKACGVIRASLKNEEVDTLAKFLGYTEEITENGEREVVYKYKEKPKNKREQLIILDECSMVSKEQLKVLKDTKISIIFIGDICQINPIGEEVSEVFNCDFFGSAELIKNERIKNRQLGDIIIDYRESVVKGFLQKKCLENNSKISDRINFNNALYESFLCGSETIYIAWTNAQVKTYNSLIREHLFGINVPDLIENERLMFDTFYFGDHYKFYTSQQVSIKSCRKVKKNLFYPECICNGSKTHYFKETVPYKKIEKCLKCNTPTSMVNYKEIEFWEIVLNNFEDELFLKPVKGMTELYPVIYKYRDRCKAQKNKILWARYYKMVESLNAPLEYAYSISVHKSQGSGYDNVFVDLENINWCQKNSEKLRLAYTAVSRAKQTLTFFK